MRVAIIGAGVAGLSAAIELQRLGATVQIFEKSRGTGGRLASKRLDWGQLDTGAQYITAQSGGFQARLKQWQAAGVAAHWAFTPYRVEAGSLQRSPDDTVRYVGTPRMTSISRYMADGLDIVFRTRIEQLDFGEGKWTLFATGGDKYEDFDWVVTSIPAEQCAVLLDTSSDLVRQVPKDLHDPCWALALATNGEVAPDIQGIFGDVTVSWVSRLSAMPGRQRPAGCDDLWMLHFAADWSLQHAKDSAEDVCAAGLAWMRHRLETELEVIRHFSHFWRYAQFDTASSAARPYFVDSLRRLAVIGAWCCGGRVEGAYQSAMHLIKDHFK